MTTQNFTVDNGLTVSGSGGNITGATNIEASGNLIVHDASVGGNINGAGNFDLDGNASIGGNLFVTGNINFTGNVTQISGNSGVFYGNASTGSGALYAGKTGYTPVANTVVQVTGDLNDYIQVNLQNTNHANTASMEIAITADDGDDTNNYLDMGIASSTWDGTQTNSLGTAVNPRDGYMYVQGGAAGGNLILGATSAGYEIKFNAGGPDAANTVARINNTGLISTGIVSATGNVRGGNINTAGNISGNYVFGNAAFMTGISGGGSYSNSNVTALLAAYGSNIISSTGNITTTGNISGSYILGNAAFMTGIPASYGNANVAANLAAFGSNPISTTGNVTSGNIVFSANTSNIVFNTTAYISGNGTPLSRDGSIVLQPYTGAGSTFPGVVIGGAGRLLAPNGSVHQIFNASDVTFQVSVKAPAIAATSTTTGGIQAAGGVGVAGSLYAGNVFTPGTLSATGNATFGTAMVIDGANNAITTTNGSAIQFGQRVNFNSVNGIYVTGNTNSQSNLIVAGFATTTGNVTGGNILTAGLMSSTGNAIHGNLNTGGLISAAGNITGNYIFGNIAFVTGNYTDANVSTLLAAFGSNTISTTGNITSGNLLTGGLISSTANITGGNLLTGGLISATGNINAGNLTVGTSITRSGSVSQSAWGTNGIGLRLPAATYTDTTNVGTLANAYIHTMGAPTLIAGNNSTYTNYATLFIDKPVPSTNVTITNNYALIANGNVSITGNITGGNANVGAGRIEGGTLIAGGDVSALGNIYLGSGTFTRSVNNIIGNAWGTSGTGIKWPAITYIDYSTAGGPVANSYIHVLGAPTYQYQLLPTTVTNAATLYVDAPIAGASATITNPWAIMANGSISVAGNISTTGITATTFSTTGNLTGANINTAGLVTATGNITGGNINTGAQVVATGNITGGNLNTGAQVIATGNITGGNLNTGAQVVATGNVTGGNIRTAGVVSATGTITGGNLATGGTVSATGNINAASNINISAGSLYRSTTNINAATWGNAGIGIVWPAITYNDTTITTGTYASSYIHVMGAPTFNYSTFVTINNAATLYVEKPIPGNNATLGNTWAILASGNISVTGNVVTPNVTTTTITATTINATNVNLTGNIGANTNGYTIGYLNIPQVVASGNATLQLSDAGKHYYANGVGNITLTVNNNVTTGFPIGTAISIVVQASSNVLVNAISGVSLYVPGSSTSGNRVIAPYGMATLMKVATDTWFINGTGVT